MVSIASDDVQSIEPPDADADAAATAATDATDAAVPAGSPFTIFVESVIGSGFATSNTASSGPLSADLFIEAAKAATDASPDSHLQIPGPYAASL